VLGFVGERRRYRRVVLALGLGARARCPWRPWGRSSSRRPGSRRAVGPGRSVCWPWCSPRSASPSPGYWLT
jgi:hypothetical protein